MKVLADTSAWVRYLRYGREGEAAAIEQLLQARDLIICGPVVAELLVGTHSEKRDELGFLLDALPWARFNRTEWHRVGNLGAELRARGLTVALTDIEIAVAAETADASIWTFDSDFQRLATQLPGLRFFSPPAR